MSIGKFLKKAARNFVQPPIIHKSKPNVTQFKNSSDRRSVKQILALGASEGNSDLQGQTPDIYRYGEGTIYMKPMKADDNPVYHPSKYNSGSRGGARYADDVNKSPGKTVIGDESLIRDFKETIYKPITDGKQIPNAQRILPTSIYPTKLADDVDSRRDNPHIPVGGDNVLNRADIKSLSQLAEGEEQSYSVLHKREYPGAVNNDSYLWQQKTNPELDKAEETHRKFKQDYKIKLENVDGVKDVGMLNDTKQKKIVDLLAEGNKEEEIARILANEANEYSAKKYEARYENSKENLTNKKLPVYGSRDGAGSTPESKIDDYNALYSINPENENNPSAWNQWDFIPLVFHDITNQEYLPFRALINSLSDQADSQWQEVKYMGRADNVMVYEGFTRSVSLDITLIAMSVEELHPMWQRINYLIGLTKPAGYTEESSVNTMALDASRFIIPPFIKFNLGDMYRHQPCFIQSVGLSIPQEASWELTRDHEGQRPRNEYQYLNGAIERDDVLVGQYPEMAQLTISLRFLEKRLPKTKNRHFGHSASEDEVNGMIDEESDRAKGFNYNLIYPNPTNPVEGPPFMRELLGDPDDKEQAEGDEFEGGNNCTPECPECAPSEFEIMSGSKIRKDEEIYAEELRLWKECACECIGKMITGDPHHVCSWEDDKDDFGEPARYIATISAGQEVPPELRRKFNEKCKQDPFDVEDLKPPMCPYPLGEPGETDRKGRMIGRTDQSASKARTRDQIQKELNLKYWIHDLTDYLASKMTLSRMGKNISIQKRPNGQVASATSANKIIVLEFNEDGNPYSYAGVPIDEELMKEFDVTCNFEQLEDQLESGLREMAGAVEPRILFDMTYDTEFVIDRSKGHVITPENVYETEQIKGWLAEWVQTQLADLPG